MPVPHYGVWACRPTRYNAEGHGVHTPHIELFFTDDSSSKERRAAINVKSNGKDSRLVFWVSRDFSHPITKQLSELDQGFHLVQDSNSDENRNHRHYRYSHYHSQDPDLEGLDFFRTKDLVDIKSGQVLWHDIPGPDNDILDKLRPILDDAIDNAESSTDNSATTFIFGASFGSGIHNIHMNQGSLPKYDNGVYSDGALLFKFDDGHWEAVFLAFASQKLPTNGEGEPEPGSKTLAEILK
ncbi:hypothetical protein N7471_000156 [Penicillium samsonianum]|uniref:uncharacterized protein n=1 Tax=Penicillium samsonianum TaxID=1882272 RepID=UPI00254729BE|nr:uncharacterized protein N7471_000156 [Penicillium samsonianum]KAJ6148957.1 hypothetical protein N7471_000156 [Penicillium samsonianum]